MTTKSAGMQERLSIRISRDTWLDLQRIAAELEMSVADVVRAAIREYLRAEYAKKGE
jgi:predicted transcriptional regulator